MVRHNDYVANECVGFCILDKNTVHSKSSNGKYIQNDTFAYKTQRTKIFTNIILHHPNNPPPL